MTIAKNPYGHTFSYRSFEGWDLSVAKQMMGVTDRITYLTCNCECGWTKTWATNPWNSTTGRKILEPDMIANEVRDTHDDEIGMVTSFGEPKEII